jgi:hypothetical protein
MKALTRLSAFIHHSSFRIHHFFFTLTQMQLAIDNRKRFRYTVATAGS